MQRQRRKGNNPDDIIWAPTYFLVTYANTVSLCLINWIVFCPLHIRASINTPLVMDPLVFSWLVSSLITQHASTWSCFWMSSFLMSTFQKREKKKMKWGWVCWPFKFWQWLQPDGEKLATTEWDPTIMVSCLFVCFSVIRSSNQWSKNRSLRLENRLLQTAAGKCAYLLSIRVREGLLLC